MPKNAESHIQKRAPGPPIEIAPVTPSMFPGPTRMAVESRNAVREEMPTAELLLFIRTLRPYLNLRT